MITLAFLLKAAIGASGLYLVSCAASRLHRKYDTHRQSALRATSPAPVRYMAQFPDGTISTQDRAVAAMLRQAGYEILIETNPPSQAKV